MDNKGGQATTIDLLRRIDPQAWATIEEPNGWSYSTNIGTLVHRAADEISVTKDDLKLRAIAMFVWGFLFGVAVCGIILVIVGL